MLQFKQWLGENAHQDDEYESLVAETAYGILAKAIQLFFQNNKQTRLSEIIKQVSKGNANDSNGRLEITIPNTIKGTQLPDHFFQHGPLKIIVQPFKGDISQLRAEYGYGHMNIRIHTPTLTNAQSYQDPDVQKMMVKLHYQIHHEATHISSGQGQQTNMQNAYIGKRAPEGSPEYNQAKANYYTDPGELRAHAKQYAVMYNRYYPGQPFNLDNMMKLVPVDSKIQRYFKGLTQPDQQTWNMDPTPYQQQFQQAGQKFLGLVNHFLDHLRSRQ